MVKVSKKNVSNSVVFLLLFKFDPYFYLIIFFFTLYHQVVCKNCSSYKAKLEYENYKLKRVCKDCYYVLDDSATIITQPVLTQGPTHRRRGVLNVKASDPALLSGNYFHLEKVCIADSIVFSSLITHFPMKEMR